MLHLSLLISVSVCLSLSVIFCYSLCEILLPYIYCYNGQSTGFPKQPETHTPGTLGYIIVQKSWGKVRTFFCLSIYYHLASL